MMIDGLNKRSHNDLDTYKFSKEYNEKEQEKRRVQKLASEPELLHHYIHLSRWSFKLINWMKYGKMTNTTDLVYIWCNGGSFRGYRLSIGISDQRILKWRSG